MPNQFYDNLDLNVLVDFTASLWPQMFLFFTFRDWNAIVYIRVMCFGSLSIIARTDHCDHFAFKTNSNTILCEYIKHVTVSISMWFESSD